MIIPHNPGITRPTLNYRHPNSQFLLNIAWLFMSTSKVREKIPCTLIKAVKIYSKLPLKVDKNYGGFYFFKKLKIKIRIPTIFKTNFIKTSLDECKHLVFLSTKKSLLVNIFSLFISKSFPFLLPKDALNYPFSVNRKQLSLPSPKKYQTKLKPPLPILLLLCFLSNQTDHRNRTEPKPIN